MARTSRKKKEASVALPTENTYIPPKDETNFAEASGALASAGYKVVKENGILMVLIDKKDYKDHKAMVSALTKINKEVVKIARGEGYERSIGVRFSEGE